MVSCLWIVATWPFSSRGEREAEVRNDLRHYSGDVISVTEILSESMWRGIFCVILNSVLLNISDWYS